MQAISNYSTYTALMKNGFYDKLFFADKLVYDWDSFLDYGCADGFLTRMIGEAFPEKEIYGYDADPAMIVKAQLLSDYGTPGFPGIHKNVHFSHNIKRLCESISKEKKLAKDNKPFIDVLFLSSVLHELYSYKTTDEIEEFWKFVFESGFKYIVIRDMMPDMKIAGKVPSRDVERTPVKLKQNVIDWCQRTGIRKHLSEFEEAFGSIESYSTCLHFMMKYKYTGTENWPREVVENYFSLSTEEFKKVIPNNYRIEHQEHYTLPFNKMQWETDFGVFVDEKIRSEERL